jgi:hypothetical protein
MSTKAADSNSLFQSPIVRGKGVFGKVVSILVALLFIAAGAIGLASAGEATSVYNELKSKCPTPTSGESYEDSDPCSIVNLDATTRAKDMNIFTVSLNAAIIGVAVIVFFVNLAQIVSRKN